MNDRYPDEAMHDHVTNGDPAPPGGTGMRDRPELTDEKLAELRESSEAESRRGGDTVAVVIQCGTLLALLDEVERLREAANRHREEVLSAHSQGYGVCEAERDELRALVERCHGYWKKHSPEHRPQPLFAELRSAIAEYRQVPRRGG